MRATRWIILSISLFRSRVSFWNSRFSAEDSLPSAASFLLKASSSGGMGALAQSATALPMVVHTGLAL